MPAPPTHGSAPRLLTAGPTAVLIEVDDAVRALSLAQHLRTQVAQRAPGVEIVPGARTVLVDGPVEGLHELVARWRPDDANTATGEVVELPTVYDGPDLADVAARWGTDADGVVARHTALEFVVAFTGFAPGFGYLTGLPGEWSVPRLASPRARVAAGSVALADTWCGVYPTASPGGWRIIGRTEAVLFDVERTPPALLTPGTRVRFVGR